MSDRDEYERDLRELEKAALEALQASRTRPLTEDEQMAVAYAAGLANAHYINLKRPERT